METFWMILAISLYICTCVFFYGMAYNLSQEFDEKFTVKNLVLTLLWPFSMWFIK